MQHFNSKKNFENVLNIACSLPWSKKEEIFYEFFTQLLLEHIFETSKSKIISEIPFEPDNDKLRINLKTTMKTSQTKTRTKITNEDTLLNYYTKFHYSNKNISRNTLDQPKKNYCEWILGCPAKLNPNITNSTFLNYVMLEKDHVYPYSKSPEEVVVGQTLCKLHNRAWKTDHLALGLPNKFLQTEKT